MTVELIVATNDHKDINIREELISSGYAESKPQTTYQEEKTPTSTQNTEESQAPIYLPG